MCGLFGFVIYKDTEKTYNELINNLARGASERGSHATGISYNINGHMAIYKRPLSAEKMKFEHYKGVRAIMGHTRHTTQGHQRDNQNNHPFKGYANGTFSLAHNGIIYNDFWLKKTENLPFSDIKTDSYILAQLLEKEGKINAHTIARAVEKLDGYYTFTILDSKDNLYIVKGESPLCIVRLEALGMIVYASTEHILANALTLSGLSSEVLEKRFEVIKANEGEILRINNEGEIERGFFTMPKKTSFLNWYDFNIGEDDILTDEEIWGVEDLKDIARKYGYDPKTVDSLIEDGFTLEEIEDFLFYE